MSVIVHLRHQEVVSLLRGHRVKASVSHRAGGVAVAGLTPLDQYDDGHAHHNDSNACWDGNDERQRVGLVFRRSGGTMALNFCNTRCLVNIR